MPLLSIIFFTPIKEYIPGYDTTEMRVQAVENIRLLDSVMIILEDYQQYALALQATISGEEYTNKYQSDTELIKANKYGKLKTAFQFFSIFLLILSPLYSDLYLTISLMLLLASTLISYFSLTIYFLNWTKQ